MSDLRIGPSASTPAFAIDVRKLAVVRVRQGCRQPPGDATAAGAP